MSKAWCNVTITGADDRVDYRDLVRLGDAYPFVEWGLLYSEKRAGTPRYPTVDWMRGAIDALVEHVPLSLHLCGRAARDMLEWDHPAWLHPGMFQRCQINGYTAMGRHGLRGLANRLCLRFVLQCRSEDTLQQVANDAAACGGDVLFDPSGGKGIEPFRWPPAPLGACVGFAGGIGPENVADAVAGILQSNMTIGEFWIDMESGVRTGDRFDVGRVERVLAEVAKIRGAHA